MKRVITAIAAVALLITLGACATSPVVEPNATSSQAPIPTPDQSLVPTAVPAAVVDVDAELFNDGFGDYVFRVGDGPTWCAISTTSQFVVCEQNEAAALYKPIPVPDSCEYSYGYQVRLWATKPPMGETAEFACAGGSYADPSGAETLASGQRITMAPFTCFVEDVTARCENEVGQYIALGPKVWAVQN